MPLPPPRGRGAAANPPVSFERLHAEPDAGALEEAGDDLLRRRVPTQLFRDHARSVLSKNTSPDVPLAYSLNPYRGCEHGCVYCLSGDTSILLADGTLRPLAALRPGDAIYGTERRGTYRRFVRTTVLAHWTTRKPAYRITLADGTRLVASGDHRFLTERGWKHVTGTEQGRGRRPHLTPSNRLMGMGAPPSPVPHDAAYQQGYLCGLVRGDGHLASYHYEREGRTHGNQHRFRLALADTEALDRAAHYLATADIQTRRFSFDPGSESRRPIDAIRTSARSQVEAITALIEWPAAACHAWQAGFLAGFFDAEGSYSGGVLRLSNTDEAMLSAAQEAFHAFGFDVVREAARGGRNRPVTTLRLRGGLPAHLRFFHLIDPAITRKRDIEGRALKTSVDLRVAAIEAVGEQELFDITTGTGDFIANGVVSHNCFARPTHEYLGFSAGLDFETRIVVKENAPELLDRALQRPGWAPQPVLLSGNTDPYQPLERRLELTRRCLQVFARHRHPVALITKNALVLRDLDVLEELAARDLVAVRLSITTLRDDLVGRLEPRTSRPAARLKAIRQLAEAGVPVGVNAAPIIPGLTDEELPAILAAAAEAGAQSAAYTLVRLPGPVEGLFVDWLREAFPDRAARVLNQIRRVRGGALTDGRFKTRHTGEGVEAELLRTLFRVTCRKLGLDGSARPLATHHFRPIRAGQLDLF